MTLFLLGAVKSFFSPKHWGRSGLEMLAIGAAVAAIAYLLGAAANAAIGGINNHRNA